MCDNSLTFQKVEPFSITTTATTKPDSPNKKIENPLKKDIFVNGIELMLHPEFTKKGKLLITVNEVSVFENETEELFGYSKYPIPLGKTLKRSNSIKIFAWNGDDSNKLLVTGNIFLAENNQPFNSQAQALTLAAFNRVVSPNDIIFANALRSPATFTELISLDGHKVMIVTVSKSTPDVEGVQSNHHDGDFLTESTFSHNGIDDTTHKTDFGSIAVREIIVNRRVDTCTTASKTYEIATSDDNIIWNDKISATQDSCGTKNHLIASHSFRYIRIIYKSLVGGDTYSGATIEFFDTSKYGGNGELSFEIRNPDSGTWSEFIASLGIMKDGDADIRKIISGNLPSTQTDFRAKYVVASGHGQSSLPFKQGITMIKVTNQ